MSPGVLVHACAVSAYVGEGAKHDLTNLFISSRAALPILSISSLVRRGLIALTSSGPKLHSTGPTSKLSRGTTSGPLLLRLGSRGRIGIGWWITWSSLSWDSDPELDTDESERSIACDCPGRPLDWSCCSSAMLVIVLRVGSLHVTSGLRLFCGDIEDSES